MAVMAFQCNFFVHIMFSPHMKLLDTSITVFYYFVLDYLFAYNDKSVDICIFIIVSFTRV